MAPRIRVPANFGREHINSEVHGNLILKLKDGGKIKTNSMIMSLNSPVIDNLTTNLSQSTLEVDDFAKEAVDCFVDSMYTGEVDKLEKTIFEDVNKMAHVFEVSWLNKRCLRFFQSDILNFQHNTYEEIVFACEIAIRAQANLKQNKYVSYFVKSAASWKLDRGIFLQKYMADFAQLSKQQIDLSLTVARNDLNIIANCLNFHLNVTLRDKGFDENSLYLLEKLDVLKFSREYPSYFNQLSYFIAEVSQTSKVDEIKPILEKFSRAKESSDDGTLSRDNSAPKHTSDMELSSSDSDELDDLEDDHFKNTAVQTDNLNKALKFGSDRCSRISFSPNMSPLAEKFSFSLWIKAELNGQSTSIIPFAYEESELFIWCTGHYRLFSQEFVINPKLTAGAWYHYCGTWSLQSGTFRAYVNGTLVGQSNTPHGRRLKTGGTLVLGDYWVRPNSSGHQFGGSMFNFNMFSKELSSTEVAELLVDGLSTQIPLRLQAYMVVKWEEILKLPRTGTVKDVEIKAEV